MTATFALPRVDVPHETLWSVGLNAWTHTGEAAVQAAQDMPGDTVVAIDIETPNTTDSFTIKCVTAAWEQQGETHTVVLDPLRSPAQAEAVRLICTKASALVLHSSPFDVPGLVHHGLLTLAQIDKVHDTLILARMAWPDTFHGHKLSDLASSVLGIPNYTQGLSLSIKAAGYRSVSEWFAKGDIHMPAYRTNAMADTVVTLRLAYPLFEAAVDRQLDHPFGASHGLTDRNDAIALVERQTIANRVMLRRCAKGMEVDLDYLDSYTESVRIDKATAEKTLTEAGCRPGIGMDLLKHLDDAGQLPDRWPRTPSTKTFPEGQWKTDKKTLERLLPNHGLAGAHRIVAHTEKILGYMDKTVARASLTGRLHPQFHVCGASATGRFSASDPELQQFPAEARPIIRASAGTKGLHSIDWSSIEPALLGWCSHDWEFIEPFENGADIYEPVQKQAGVSRKVAKVVVLAGMFGQSVSTLASSLGSSKDEAENLRKSMRTAMPKASRYMGLLVDIGTRYGLAVTVSGRILTIPQYNGAFAAHTTATNYLCQGSCADLIYDTVVEAERRGIGDALMLLMHDEVICETEVAQELYEIMTTPPPRLIEWCGGRVPTIRCDSEFLGDYWRVCE